jgi:hypothetical protein
MIAVERIADWLGEDVLSDDDEKAGKLDEVYLDGNVPILAEVKRGGLRRKTHLVPLDGALAGRDYVRFPYPAKLITDAPGHSGDGAPDEAALNAVADHFNLRSHGKGKLEGSKARAARFAAADAAEQRARELEDESRRQAVHAEQSTRESEEAAMARKRASEDADAARVEAERARSDDL